MNSEAEAERRSLVHNSASPPLDYLQPGTLSPPLGGAGGLSVWPPQPLPWHQSDIWSTGGSTSTSPPFLTCTLHPEVEPQLENFHSTRTNRVSQHEHTCAAADPRIHPTDAGLFTLERATVSLTFWPVCDGETKWWLMRFCSGGQSSCWCNSEWDS